MIIILVTIPFWKCMYDVTYLIICTIFVANDNEFDVLLKLSFNIIYIDTQTYIFV